MGFKSRKSENVAPTPEPTPEPTLRDFFFDGVSPEVALRNPDRVRIVRVRRDDELSPKLLACTKLRKLEIRKEISALPAFIAKFRHLRELDVSSYSLKTLPSFVGELSELRRLTVSKTPITQVPTSLWSLPRLTDVVLIDTKVAKLDGLDKATRLEELTLHGSPVAGDINELIEGFANARRMKWLDGIDIPPVRDSERVIEVALPDSKAKISAGLANGSLGDRLDLSSCDLSGEAFDDLDLTGGHNLKGANLANSTWVDCRFFHTDLGGAKLEGASFVRCSFWQVGMSNVSARGVTFDGCYISGAIDSSDLRDSRFLKCDPASLFSITNSKATKATFELSADSPRNGHYLSVEGADLRGASITVELTPDAAARLASKKSPVRWSRPEIAKAKTDATTTIEFSAIASHEKKPTVGPKATPIGTLHGINAAIWFVAADAKVARAWGGSILSDEYEEDPLSDFTRAMEFVDTKKARMPIGDGHGVVASVGDCGWSHLWKLEDGFALLYDMPDDDIDRKDHIDEFGARVAQLPTVGRPLSLGQFEVSCGCVALMLPYRKGGFSEKQIAKAVKQGKVVNGSEHDYALVPIDNGLYEVWEEQLDHNDELGQFFTRIRIASVKTP